MTDPGIERTESRIQQSESSTQQSQSRTEFLDQITKGIAHELHDGPVQWIVGAKMLCESLLRKAAEGTSISPDQLEPILAALQRALVESRQIMRGLDAMEVEDGHWFNALKEDLALTRSTLCHVKTPEILFNVDPSTESLPGELAQTLYRILREAIWNALRHSHGKQILCRTWREPGWLHAEVSDDGVGINSTVDQQENRNEGHWGLRSIHSRAAEAGGHARLTSGTGLSEELFPTNQGTRWEISLPLNPLASS